MSHPFPEPHAKTGSVPADGVDGARAPAVPSVPDYLRKVYWWAYVHPRAVSLFEREWLVNLILFGNYARLRNAALAEIDPQSHQRVLQVACVYGDLTPRLLRRLGPDATLDVADVLPIQLQNLRRKLPPEPPEPRVTLLQRDAAALGVADGSYDCVLLFFLLHEQPEPVRRATLAEALRVVKPGGKIVIVDYHRPSRTNPLYLPMRTLLRRLEPYAEDLWRHELQHFFPAGVQVESSTHRTWFGGLYQMLVLKR